MEQRILSKKSAFIDRWSQTEMVNAKLGITLIVMMVICLALTASVGYMVTKSRPVYYISGTSSVGIAYPQSSSKSTVAIFTASWVLNWSNFTPATVEAVYKHAQQFMSPRLLNQTKTRLKRDIEQVKSNNISSMFSLNQDPQVEEEEEGFSVTLSGDKGVFMGKEEIKTQKMVYHLQLRSISPTDWNPYGLVIEDITQETSI